MDSLLILVIGGENNSLSLILLPFSVPSLKGHPSLFFTHFQSTKIAHISGIVELMSFSLKIPRYFASSIRKNKYLSWKCSHLNSTTKRLLPINKQKYFVLLDTWINSPQHLFFLLNLSFNLTDILILSCVTHTNWHHMPPQQPGNLS